MVWTKCSLHLQNVSDLSLHLTVLYMYSTKTRRYSTNLRGTYHVGHMDRLNILQTSVYIGVLTKGPFH